MNHYKEEEAPVEFLSKLEEYYNQIFYQAIEIVVNCAHNRFQQKNHIKTLQMEILLLKALREGDFDLKLRQMSSFLYTGLLKSKLETKLKSLNHIFDEKQVEIKDTITMHLRSC